MKTILLEILDALKGMPEAQILDSKHLAEIIRRHNKNIKDNEQHHAKKKLLPYYLNVKKSDPKLWASWNVNQTVERQLFKLLQIKPRRTASGVATITVMTKPWKCSSDCLYCPNDLRVPKSYMSDEPACQRAERNYFDPYLQVVSRLRALTLMGHATDKIELIILGGTWSDYPTEYQIWFVKELFRALNDFAGKANFVEQNINRKHKFYEDAGLSNCKEELVEQASKIQQEVNSGAINYNQAIELLYFENIVWQNIAAEQISDIEELEKQHHVNETALHRVVGLVIETRPDTITYENLKLLRRLGCTKVQVGIQSLNTDVLYKNNRSISLEKIQEAFELLRIFGFKIHAHFMLNLYGSSCDADKDDYQRLVANTHYMPDEIKLYPCVLVDGTGLCAHYANKSWKPYTEDELLDVLITGTLNTPPFVRISRMIRDISAHDIVAGNKKTSLRQMVERKALAQSLETSAPISEIRYREISTNEIDIDCLKFENLSYETSISNEYFMQWVTPENKIAGFLRLSLPKISYVLPRQAALPVAPHEAMIREVHVYGKVAKLHTNKGTVQEESATRDGAEPELESLYEKGPQHLGLGRQLIEAACSLAKAQGYDKINVISSVGTRQYYRNLGFEDNGLYQRMLIDESFLK